MSSTDRFDQLLPSPLLAEVEAVAALEHRPIREILLEAVEGFLRDRQSGGIVPNPVVSPRSPQDAAARIMKRRRSHRLPQDTSIRDLLVDGRA